MLKVTQNPKPLVLVILDGWGIAQDSRGNAITRANCTNFNGLWFSFPHALLVTAGQSVGLPEGQVGNSEVGHLNLGAGRIVFQDLLRINMSIADGTFYENESFLSAIDHAKKYDSNIHLIGLVGLGSVHSEMEHLYALLRLLKKEKIPSSRVKLHLFADGRDSPPTSAKIYLDQLEKRLLDGDLGQIASICGRYFGMDRDNRWERTGKAYFAMLGRADKIAKNAIEAVDNSYHDGKTDEYIEPTIIVDASGVALGQISENDAVIIFNYRPDRARQITKTLVMDDLKNLKTSSGESITAFERGPKISNLFSVALTQYEKNLPVTRVAFRPEEVTMPIARVFAERGARQLHIAETEKYAHVTYFFNGGRETAFDGEDRILIPSPKVASYDLKPEMSAPQITKTLIEKISSRSYDFIVVNFANADMVAHSGNFQAAIKGVQTIDYCLSLVSQAVFSQGGGLVITSDHGNAEEMINLRTGEDDTEHNVNPAPCIFAISEFRGYNLQLPQGLLADLAPSICAILKIPKPSQMTGRNLLS